MDDRTIDFGYVDNTFINLYSKENPILDENETCYFLFNSIDNYHRPIVAKGKIISDIFSDGMNKIYYIQLLEIMESLGNLDKYVWGNSFSVIPYDYINKKGAVKRNPKITASTDEKFFKDNLFKIECFFVRTSLELIIELRKEYIKIILEDLKKSVTDIENLLIEE